MLKQYEASAEHEASARARAAAEEISKSLPIREELDKVWYMFSHMILSNSNLTTDGYEQICTILCENQFKVLIRKPFDGIVLFAAVSMEDGMYTIKGTCICVIRCRVMLLCFVDLDLFDTKIVFIGLA